MIYQVLGVSGGFSLAIFCTVAALFVIPSIHAQFFHSDGSSSTSTTRLLDCDYTGGTSDHCHWNPDPNDWGRYRWRVQPISSLTVSAKSQNPVAFALCLHRPSSVRSEEALTSRLWSPSVRSGKDDFALGDHNDPTDFVDTLEQQSVSDEIVTPRCLKLTYRYFPGELDANNGVKLHSQDHVAQPTLALLKRQKG